MIVLHVARIWKREMSTDFQLDNSIEECTVVEVLCIHRNQTDSQEYIPGWTKVGLQLRVRETQSLFLYCYLFINYCIIYLYYLSSYYYCY